MNYLLIILIFTKKMEEYSINNSTDSLNHKIIKLNNLLIIHNKYNKKYLNKII